MNRGRGNVNVRLALLEWRAAEGKCGYQLYISVLRLAMHIIKHF